MFFGPQSRLMPISVTGNFSSVGMMFRPGTGFALAKAKMTDHLDRLTDCDEMGLPGTRALEMISDGATPDEWLVSLEDLMREIIDRAGAARPDPVVAHFETLALDNPVASISEFAKDMGIEQRRLERLVRRDFGLPPKQVLRRARALDMASYLRGVADFDEANDLTLRYYDQSHLIREFVEFFGMPPNQFVKAPQPLLTLCLQTRQARRLEVLERVAPGGLPPWQKAACLNA